MKFGKPIAEKFLDPPSYDEGQVIFCNAWLELNDERKQSTERVYKIERRQVMQWLEWYGLDRDYYFKETLWAFIVAMDRLWLPKELDRLNKRRKREDRKATRNAKRSRR